MAMVITMVKIVVMVIAIAIIFILNIIMARSNIAMKYNGQTTDEGPR